MVQKNESSHPIHSKVFPLSCVLFLSACSLTLRNKPKFLTSENRNNINLLEKERKEERSKSIYWHCELTKHYNFTINGFGIDTKTPFFLLGKWT
jgi:hypothetical protein